MEINLKIVAVVAAMCVVGPVGLILIRWVFRALGLFVALALGTIVLALVVALVRGVVTGGISFIW